MADTANTSAAGSGLPKSRADRLAEIETAITKVLAGGQSYRIGSRTLTRADLKMLKAMRDEIMAESDGDSPLLDNTYVAVFERR